ncbi:Cathepsin B-like cysteine proteinase 4, partial [Toxocara canis]
YFLSDEAVEMLKREIYLFGPVLACFTVYEDFQHYSSGIYHPFTFPESQELYGHCAKLLGWGEENGEEYWLYMNTWGREWGEDGLL